MPRTHGNFLSTDFKITCDGSRRRRMGHSLALFGQARSMPLPCPASIISRRQDFHAHQPAERNRIAQGASCVREVSHDDRLSETSLSYRRFCNRNSRA